MKIRSQKDVDRLEEAIKMELGIDVSKYKNEEVVESFVELLVFPEYVINWVIRPVLFFLFLYLIGFKGLDLVHIEYLIYGIIGFGLFLTSGLFLGLIFLLDRMKTDMWGIIDYSIGIMKEAVLDLKEANLSVNEENRKNKLSLLFKGIIHIVTIPLLSKAISQKVPFVGGIVNRVVKSILIIVSDKIKFDESQLDNALNIKKESPDLIEDYSKIITSDSKGLEKVLKITFRIANFPLIICFAVSLFSLVIFLYLIN